MRIGVAADHGGFDLKQKVVEWLNEARHDVTDFGNDIFAKFDDYPDYVIPLAKAVVAGEVERGIAVCGSGVGACIAANKVRGARASLVQDVFSARQGVEDDNMTILCLGGRTIGPALAREVVESFLGAKFTDLDRHRRRLKKVAAVEGE